MPPIIGINASFSHEDSESAGISLRATYVDAVTTAGGIPVILPPVQSREIAQQQAALCDGFVFIGGSDIDPARYGKTQHPATNRLATRREEHDFALIKAAMDRRKPFLAICLGCQEVNVALGGTLIQDINSETSTTIQHAAHQSGLLRHDVKIEPGTLICDLVGTTSISTNTSHHQAVEQPAESLKVTGRAADGIIESLEMRDYPFGLAIQWHPESLVSEPEHLALFKGLIKAARGSERRK